MIFLQTSFSIKVEKNIDREKVFCTIYLSSTNGVPIMSALIAAVIGIIMTTYLRVRAQKIGKDKIFLNGMLILWIGLAVYDSYKLWG